MKLKLIRNGNIKLNYILRAVLFCIVFTALLYVFSFAIGFAPQHLKRTAHGMLGILAAVLATALFLRFDRKKFPEIGLRFERKTLLRFFTGVMIGVVIMGLLATFALFYADAEIELNPRSNLANFLLATLPLIPLALMEELGFRAYPLEILKGKVGLRLAIFITSLLFAGYHIAIGWTVASSFYGPAVWGCVFGLAAIYSKGIAMPTGIHYAANLTTSAIGGENSEVSIWITRHAETTTINQGEIDWLTIIPSLSLLILALVSIELFVRQRVMPNKFPGSPDRA